MRISVKRILVTLCLSIAVLCLAACGEPEETVPTSSPEVTQTPAVTQTPEASATATPDSTATSSSTATPSPTTSPVPEEKIYTVVSGFAEESDAGTLKITGQQGEILILCVEEEEGLRRVTEYLCIGPITVQDNIVEIITDPAYQNTVFKMRISITGTGASEKLQSVRSELTEEGVLSPSEIDAFVSGQYLTLDKEKDTMLWEDFDYNFGVSKIKGEITENGKFYLLKLESNIPENSGVMIFAYDEQKRISKYTFYDLENKELTRFEYEYYQDGSIKKESYYEDGKPVYVYEYYQDGSDKTISYYEAGELVQVTEYYPDGQDKKELYYEEGELVGAYEYDENGNLIE